MNNKTNNNEDNRNNLKKIELKIEGISCQACVAKIERKLSKIDGIYETVVNISNNKGNISYDENKIELNEILAIIKKLGFEPKKIDELKNDNKISEEKKLKSEFLRAKWIIVFSCILMYIAMGNMFGLALPKIISPKINVGNFVLIQFILTTIIMILAKRFYIVGFKQLYLKSPNMDSLIAVGTSSAYFYSLYISYKIIFLAQKNLISSLYYESASMIVAFIVIGKYLENLSKGKTSEAIKKIIEFQPKQANIIKDKDVISIDIEKINLGDIVFIRPGEKIPVDGLIIEGYSTVNEAMLTGESLPVSKKIGEKVYSGSINIDGILKVKVEVKNSDTVLSKIAKLVENAQMTKAPIAKFADKVSLYFVPAVMLIAVFSSLVWFFLIKYSLVNIDRNYAEYILTIFVSVLIIACPCSLGLATPTAIMVGTGKGAKLGILIKSGEALENLNNIDTVVFDKTGTLTKGEVEIIDIIGNIKKEEILKISASLEVNSEHPLGKAIYKSFKEKKEKLYNSTDFLSISGKGVVANISSERYVLGNRKLLEEYSIKNAFEREAYKFENLGNTVVFLGNKNSKEVLGFIILGDMIREGSKKLIENIRERNIDICMLTGDNKNTARIIGNSLEIDNVIAEVNPEDKYKKIIELQKKGKKVAVVGDGINDSPALAQADVGISIGSATDIAIESADIILVRNNIETILTAIRLSEAIIKNIKQNLFWAFIYNIVGIPIAAGGLYLITGHLLNPMIAAFIMGMSSISVVSNALRLRKFK